MSLVSQFRAHPIKTNRGRFSPGGFTLVELLVVIGIIAVLVGIIFPAVSASRQQTRTLICQSNLRNLYQACLMFSIDHADELPIGTSRAEQANNTAAMRVCVWAMVSGKNGVADLSVPVNGKYPAGVIWKYLGGDDNLRRGVIWCPQDGNEANASAAPSDQPGPDRNFSYSWNDQVRTSGAPSATPPTGMKLRAISAPNKKIYIVEEVGPNDARSTTPWTGSSDLVSGRHGKVSSLQPGTAAYNEAGRSNVVYFDGHLELVPVSSMLGNSGLFTLP